MNMNCNSLVSDNKHNKHALLASMLEEHKPDVLCVCESKLDSAISDSAVLPPPPPPPSCGYEIINRKDHRLGAGGVLIAVKNTFVASPVMDLDTDCEVTWSRIELAKTNLYSLVHSIEHPQLMTLGYSWFLIHQDVYHDLFVCS